MERRRYYMTFSRTSPLRFLSHLDMMRLWERALRRGGFPLRYSQGYHPRPRLSLAWPLSVGMTGAAEWLELEMRELVPPSQICRRLPPQLPAGLELDWVGEAPRRARALTASVCGAAYRVVVPSPPSRAQIQQRLSRFLAAESWPIQIRRKGEVRQRDLRKGVVGLQLEGEDTGRSHLHMVLRHNVPSSARPQAVLEMLGANKDLLIHRERLLFSEPPHVSGAEVRCLDE